MSPEAAIALVSSWLDAVRVESAAERVADQQEEYRARTEARSAAPPSPDPRTDSAEEPEPRELEHLPLSDVPRLVRGARHEASHAAVGVAAGLKVGFARIDSDGGAGAAAYEANAEDLDEMMGRVATDLAAVIFELIEGADPWRREHLRKSGDMLVARLNIEICRALMPEWHLSSRFFSILSVGYVMANRAAILRVASALLDAGELDGARIRALVWNGPKEAPT